VFRDQDNAEEYPLPIRQGFSVAQTLLSQYFQRIVRWQSVYFFLDI
jgi:hypothetical protein